MTFCNKCTDKCYEVELSRYSLHLFSCGSCKFHDVSAPVNLSGPDVCRLNFKILTGFFLFFFVLWEDVGCMLNK